MRPPDRPVPPAAVLWDLDGTLIDTEPLWIKAEYALVGAHGGTWSDDHARSIVGSDLLDAARYIRRVGGVDLEPVPLVEGLIDNVLSGVGDDPVWRPGALGLLDELATAGVPCALVTMSWRRLVDHIVALLPEALFQAVVAGDQVANGKPHPEPYLKAASLLGVDPADCIAIEDSPTGADSANAAGCTVLAVPNLVDIPQRQGRVIMSSLSPVDLATLRRMFRR
ncbi:MAG: HAD family phosphatase [Acidimicrobiia bacterium]|jgi:beta-phosphoglucomutase-like phosphatase (HAD superfamily)|nr:HAD family phosphatase [Acidimicrobiia bacterium]